MDAVDKTSITNVSITELSLDELRAEYLTVKNVLGNVQSQLDQKNQELYDCKRLLKTAEALEKDYQQEIESLQSSESEENLKLKSTVQKLETDLACLKQFSDEQILYLESELTVKNDEIKELQGELKSVAENFSRNVPDDYDVLKQDNSKLRNEIDALKDSYQLLTEENEVLKNNNFLLEEQIVTLKAEVDNVQENLQCKREELFQANNAISSLQEEIVVLRNELDMLQKKPLDKDSKGNSLFAEVNDKRIEQQKIIQNMRVKYTEMKNEYANLMKQISSLRTENIKLRERWQLDLSGSASDEQCVLRSYQSRIEALETVIKSYQKEATEKQNVNGCDSKCDYFFLENLLQKKGNEIETLRQELSTKSLRNLLLSDELKTVNTELRKAKLEIIGLEQELVNLKQDAQLLAVQRDYQEAVETVPATANDHIKRFSQNVDFSRLEARQKNSLSIHKDLPDTEDKENVDNSKNVSKHGILKGNVKQQTKVSKEDPVKDRDLPSRGVTFSESPPPAKPARKGAKIIKSNPVFVPSIKK